jgi:predicted phage terminase large subunit-like protein
MRSRNSSLSPEARLEALQRLDYLKSEQSLAHYVRSAWRILEPEVPLLWNWHHDYICEHLEAAELGQILRMIINIAPRTTKSVLTNISFPTWAWIRKPTYRFLFGSYAESLATKHSVLRRNLIESAWYQRGYGSRYALSSDVNTKSEFQNNKTGQMKAAGIRGSITGEGGDFLVIDDPHNPKGAESELEREATIQNFDLAWSNRLNNKKTGRIILIMQRLRENDLTGHLLEKDLGYLHLKIPSIAEERQRLVFPVSGRVVEREAGDLMHPERDGPKELDQAKKDMGPYGFAGQHQQDPVPKKGGIFSTDMFDEVDLPEEFDFTFITADTAYKEKEENDFTVFTAFGMKDDELYILDVYRKQIKAAEIEKDATPFLQRFQEYGFRGVWIEPKGHGIYLNDKLPQHPYGIMIPSESDRDEFFSDRRLDKVMRANNAVPYLANRSVHLGRHVKDKEILIKEAATFPKAAHDDFVDTLVDGIKFAFGRPRSSLDAY